MVGPELAGEKTRLRPIADGDLERRVAWLNDAETIRLFTGMAAYRTYDISDAERWRRSIEADLATLAWAIDSKWGRHIGDVDLHDISRHDGSARLTILIGEKSYWGKGYGTDALTTLLGHAFNEMGLDMVNLRVYDFNRRAIRCYEKCGFVQSAGGWGSHPGEVYMVATKDHFMALRSDAVTVHT